MRSSLTLGKSRIEGLSDGVFSIAMTLLVLKLEVPSVMHHSGNRDMLEQLLGMAPEFATYVITFLIAGGFWFLHHLTFHYIRHVSGFLLWINLLFLMMVSLLPFSAGLMSHLFVHPVSQYFYIGNLIVIALLLNTHWLHARSAGLLNTSEQPRIARLTLRVLVTLAVFVLSLLIAVVLPEWSWLPLPVFLTGGVVYEWLRPV